MITPDDIVFHLQAYLPAFTPDFNEQIQGSASIANGVVTISANNHGVSVGRKVVIRGSEFQNQLSAVELNNDGTTRFTTTFDHDITEPRLADDPKTITLTGIGAPWDGTHNIDSVPNRRNFEIVTPAGETAGPIITDGFLIETRAAGLSGVMEVVTVGSANSFTVNAPSNIPSLPDGSIGDVTVLKSVRCSGVADLTRASELYTQRNTSVSEPKPYIFVIMLDTDVSKDRHSLNDGVLTATSQNEMKQTLLQNFVTAIFIPTASNDVSGFKAQGLAYNDYFRALTSSMYGFKFNDPDSQQNYVAVHNGNGPAGDYNSSYYIHVYNWQVPSTITFANGFNLQPDVAFRDISHTWDINSDDMAQMSGNINLDEEPL